MLDKAVEMLKDRGLSLGFDTVRLEDAIVAADAPRASAYRAWTDNDGDRSPQTVFHDELAAHILDDYPKTSAEHSITVREAIEALGIPEDLATLTQEERSLALWHVVRAGGNYNQDQLLENPLWPIAIALTGALGTRYDSAELEHTWKAGERMLAERFIELYQGLTAMFGFRIRSVYTWEQFDAAVAGTAQGLALRRGLHDDVEPIARATGPDGADQEWSLFAVCLEALLRQFFEPDPDAKIPVEFRFD